MTTPKYQKYMSTPVVYTNTKTELSFLYPNWRTEKMETVTYRIGKVPDGIDYIRIPDNKYHYPTEKNAKLMVHRLVYEDEGTFGSAGLLQDGFADTIRLKGFTLAVKNLKYDKKWQEIADHGFEAHQKRMEDYYKNLFPVDQFPNVRIIGI